MRSKGSNSMGRFSVNFEITNYRDLVLAKSGLLEPDKIRRQTISGVVDPGAAMLVLPQSLVKELGLPMRNNIQVRDADGRRAKRREAQDAYVELLGRDGNFAAIVEPKRTSALIGAIVLEQLDLLVDCQPQRLIPRDPSGPIYEIE
jgi:predicted aspartyl protease